MINMLKIKQKRKGKTCGFRNMDDFLSCSQNKKPVSTKSSLGMPSWSRIFKRLRSPGIGSKEPILPAYVARAGRYDNPICRTGPPGYIGRGNRFLGIYSWDPLTFTNSASGPHLKCKATLSSWVGHHHWSLFGLYVQHCKENPISVFHFWELRGLSPNFHLDVSVSDLYIPRIGPHTSLQQNRQTDPGILKMYHRYMSVGTGRQNIIILFWK